LARQNKAHKKAVKVLTEDDIRSMPATGVSVVGSVAKDGATDATSPAKTVAGVPSKGAAASKSAAPVSELKKALLSCKEQQESWKRSAQHYEELLANETNDFRRQMYQDALENDRKNAALFQKKAEQLQDDLAAAEKAAK
jgi:precorrin-2 methylase